MAILQIRPLDQGKAILDVFAPKDDGGIGPTQQDPEIKKVQPTGLQIRPPATGLQLRAPETPTAPQLTVRSSPDKSLLNKTLDVVPAVGRGLIKAGSEGIDTAIKGGAKLITDVAAPVMSQPSLDKLEKAGLYEKPQGNVALQAAKDYSQAAYGALMSPIAPLMDKIEQGAQKAGVPQKGIDYVNAGMDLLGVAGVPDAKRPIVAAADKTLGMADQAMQPVRKVFAPASDSLPQGAATAAIKREQIGEAARDTAVSAANLEKHAQRFDNLSLQEAVDFPRYMENYSKPAQRPQLPPDLATAADDLRESYKLRADKIQQTKSMKNMPLVEDYLARNFKEATPQQQQAFSTNLAGKQGKGGFTKARQYPTYEESLKAARAAGMEPVEPNFIKAANLYNANTDMFIAHNRAIDAMKKNGLLKYGPPNRVPPGWAPLEGRLATKTGVDKKSGKPVTVQAYAPVDAARVYNNYISKGISGDSVSVMQKAQRAFNAVTMLKLGLSSVWHAGITGTAAISSDLARGTRQALHGEPLKGTATIAKAPFAPYRVAREGSKFHKQYLKMTNYGPNAEKLVRVATKANTLQSKRPAYMNSAGPQSFKFIIKNAKSVPAAAGGVAAHALGKTLDGVSGPMFDKWIPNMKRGVIVERLNQWIQEHPGSTEAEQTAYARKLGDSVDNRFGEMMRDNLFWNKAIREGMQFGLLSYSWVAGAMRMLSGAAKESYDTVRYGKELGSNAEYLIANAVTAAALNSVYQYLHTGSGPQDTRDLFFPKTGGKQHVGKSEVAERAVLPTGHWTQIAEYMHDTFAELYNEGNIGAKVVWEALTNRDYRGMPIAKPADLWHGEYMKEVPDAVWRYMKYIGGQAMTPISIQSYFNRNKDTGIAKAETIGMGARPAPAFIAAPEKVEGFQEKADKKLWKSKLKSDQRLSNRREYNAKKPVGASGQPGGLQLRPLP